MSTGLLDQVLDGTRVISEQHDINKLAVELPDFDDDANRRIESISRRGGWDASEYGITRDQAIAQIRSANTPEARDRAVRDIIERAQRRASLDTSTSNVAVMVAGELPWHGLGVLVDKAATSDEAIKLASLDWRAEKLPLYYEFDGTRRTQDQVFGIVRSDTGQMLGKVGARYQIIQNVDGFDFLDGVLGEYGAHYETAGSIYGGRKVWMLASMPEQRFSVTAGDEIDPYVLFANCHDGTGAAHAFPTTVRVVCANTYRTAGSDRSKGISIRHTGSVKAKIAFAKQTLGLAANSFIEFRDQAGILASTRIPDVTHYANDVLDAVLDISEIEVRHGADALAAALDVTNLECNLARKSFARKIERRGEVLQDIMARYESERCGVSGLRGTAWSAWNAITEHADHNRLGVQARDMETRLSRRFESAISGDADKLKQVAFRKAMEYAR